MEDYLVKALANDGFVRAYAVRATNTVAEAQQRHDTWHTSSAALGRAFIGSPAGENQKQINDTHPRRWPCRWDRC